MEERRRGVRYKVTHKPKEKLPYWIVTGEDKWVSSGLKHKEKKTADIHCRNLNAHFGDKNV